MLTRLSIALYRYSNRWTITIAILVYAFFISTVMPQQAADSRGYAGKWGAPDGHFFYTPDKLYAEISLWDEPGRQDYINFRLGLDILWALAYTGFLVTLISGCLNYALPPEIPRRLWNTFPFITLLCDYAENAAGITLIANYAIRLDVLAWFAASLTAMKWLTLVLAHCLLLYAIACAVRKRLSTNRAEG